MKRPTAPFLDNNPRVGFSWDVRKRTSTSNDADIPGPTKNCSPSLQHRVQEFFIRTSESHLFSIRIWRPWGGAGTDYMRDRAERPPSAQLGRSSKQPGLVHVVYNAVGVLNKHQQMTMTTPRNSQQGRPEGEWPR